MGKSQEEMSITLAFRDAPDSPRSLRGNVAKHHEMPNPAQSAPISHHYGISNACNWEVNVGRSHTLRPFLYAMQPSIALSHCRNEKIALSCQLALTRNLCNHRLTQIPTRLLFWSGLSHKNVFRICGNLVVSKVRELRFFRQGLGLLRLRLSSPLSF